MEFLKTLLSISLSGSLCILCLLAIGPFVKKRLGRQWQSFIWLVAVLRLLLPFAPDTNLMGVLFAPPAAGQTAVQPAPGEPQAENFLLPDQRPAPASSQSFSLGSLPDHLPLIWLMVAAALLVRKITLYQSFMRYIRAGRREVADPQVLDRFFSVCEEARVKRPVEFFINPLIASPMLTGFFRPAVILSAIPEDNRQFRMIILHELMHYKRRDMFFKWLAQAAVCLHWFNPLVYLMGREIERCCELGCDEAVIQKLEPGEIRAYGDTLLAALQPGGSYRDRLASVTLGESGELLKERLDAIMNFSKKPKSAVCAAAVLTAFLCLGATYAGAYVAPAGPLGVSSGLENPAAPVKENSFTEAASSPDPQVYTHGKAYIRNMYFYNGYFLDVAWDADNSKYPATREFSLDVSYRVSFSEETRGLANQEAVLEAIRQLLGDKAEKGYRSVRFDMCTLVILKVEGPFSQTADQLAEKYYAADDIAHFSAAANKASPAVIQKYAKSAYTDDRIDFWSVLSKDLSPQERKEFLNKAYAEDRVDFFSVLSGELSAQESAGLARQAYRDNRVDFFSVLCDGFTAQERSDLAKQAYQDNRIDFLSVLSGELSAQESAGLARQAYRDNRVDFFSVLCDALTPQERSDLAKQAYQDNRIDFLSVLSDSLSEQDRSALLKQAEKEKRVDFVWMLLDE